VRVQPWVNLAAAMISLQGSSCTGRSATREGGLIEGPSQSEKVLLARNAELERMVGRLAMENELLKKAVQYTVQRRRENSSPITAKSLRVSRGGAK